MSLEPTHSLCNMTCRTILISCTLAPFTDTYWLQYLTLLDCMQLLKKSYSFFFLFFLLYFSSALVVRLLTNRFIWEYDPTLGKNTITLRALVLRRLSRAFCLFETLSHIHLATFISHEYGDLSSGSRRFGVHVHVTGKTFLCRDLLLDFDDFMPTLPFTL